MITSAVSTYAALYGVDPADRFDIQLEGSSIGRKSVENDTVGNVIGLSSADVVSGGIESLRFALDAIAVIVHPDNHAVSDLSLSELYDIFSGKTRRFADVGGTK